MGNKKDLEQFLQLVESSLTTTPCDVREGVPCIRCSGGQLVHNMSPFLVYFLEEKLCLRHSLGKEAIMEQFPGGSTTGGLLPNVVIVGLALGRLFFQWLVHVLTRKSLTLLVKCVCEVVGWIGGRGHSSCGTSDSSSCCKGTGFSILI